jgi:hypothetical protein
LVEQLPQKFTSVFRLRSHPSDVVPLQLPKPALQVPSVHEPDEQLSVAFASEHGTPQLPQSVSVFVGRSHPLPGIPSQLAKCVLQAPSVQLPLAQLSAALARSHVVPQLPQSVRVLIARSQPLPGTPSQSAKSPVHEVITHIPLAHDSAALARLQPTPQPPQSVSVVMLRSQPFAGLPSQSAHPVSHDAIAQVPVEQVSVAWASVHAVPQPPQSVTVRMLRSQPFASVPSQSSKPALQEAIAHEPVEQVAVAFARVHGMPQLPQSVSVRMLRSQPFAGFPSQSSQPASQLAI